MAIAADGGHHRVVVTGAGGFVGGYVRAVLSERGRSMPIDVHAFDSRTELDLSDRAAVDAAIAAIRPTAVIHLAAIAAPRQAQADPQQAWAVNLMGTMNIARSVVSSAPAARFIQVGSSESYGASFAAAKGPVDEDVALKPMNTYAATKAAADLLIGQMAHDGLNAVRFRPFNHTGPGQDDIYVIASFARQIAEILVRDAEPVIRVGNLDARRDFLDVRDVARAYVDTALRTDDLPRGAVFNLATGAAAPIGDHLRSLIAAAGRPIDIVQDPARMRANDIPLAAGNADAARDLLGWAPSIPFATTLRDVLSDWTGRVRQRSPA